MESLTRGERFKDARTVHNQHGSQTMSAVQNATGVSASLIADLENDEKDRKVNYIDVATLAKHYGVTTDWLCGLVPDHHVKPCASSELGLSPKAVDQIVNIYTTSPDGAMQGLNMLLSHRNIHVLAEKIKRITDSVKIEKERASSWRKTLETVANEKIPTTWNEVGAITPLNVLDIADNSLSNSLENEIISLHPELKGSISVSYGRSLVESQIRELESSFGETIRILSGYLELLLDISDI